MWISELTIINCRNIKSLNIEFNPNINFIYGANGSGKTSILEAMSMLSYGRSFRTARVADVISYDENSIISSATISGDTTNVLSAQNRKHENQTSRIGIEKSRDTTLIRLNRQNIKSQADLSKLIPISVIHPLSHQLITGASSIRRSFIDWIAFYKYPEFHALWKHYQVILKQRNAALKNPKLYYAIEHLTTELCRLQKPIDDLRCASLKQLNKTLLTLIPTSLEQFIPELSLRSGLPKDVSLEEGSLIDYYQSIKSYEKKKGRTVKGIHTAGLDILLDGVSVSSCASRGQSKIISTLLHISQNHAINKTGIICIDDLSAEIDKDNHDLLLKFILSLGSQTFITSTSKPSTTELNTSFSMFHVKHGNLYE